MIPLEIIRVLVRPIEGWLSDEQMSLMAPYVANLPHTATLVEIGTFAGKSAYFFHLVAPDITIITIDPRKVYVANGNIITPPKTMNERVLQERGIIQLQGESTAIARILSGQIDCLFIDGDHTYEKVKQDCEAWIPKVTKGTIIIFHDYEPTHQGVIEAVDEQIERKVIKKILTGAGLCITEKI